MEALDLFYIGKPEAKRKRKADSRTVQANAPTELYGTPSKLYKDHPLFDHRTKGVWELPTPQTQEEKDKRYNKKTDNAEEVHRVKYEKQGEVSAKRKKRYKHNMR